jgi:hypothetical protein
VKRLATFAAKLRPDVVRAVADMWKTGSRVVRGRAPSRARCCSYAAEATKR